MKTRHWAVVVFFSLMCFGARAEVFTSMFSGPWGDPYTWWGNSGIYTLPGAGDDVVVSPFTEVVGGGICHSLTVLGSPGNPGRLVGEFNQTNGCMVEGDLVCDGVITFGASGTYYLEVGGNIHVTGTVFVNTITLTGTGGNVSGRATLYQQPGAEINAAIGAGPLFPGLRLLSDLALNHSIYNGSISGMEIDMAGWQMSKANINGCSLMDDPPALPATLLDCNLSSVEAFVPVTLTGITELLDSGCIFHADLDNSGSLIGPQAVSGSLTCANLSNTGSIQPGWNATLNIFCNGNIHNAGLLVSDIVFTNGYDHTWREGGSPATNGNVVNMSESLVLNTDMTLSTGNSFNAGGLYLNGFTLWNANLYDGDLYADFGTLDNCALGSLNVYGTLAIDSYARIMDSSVVCHGPLVINGNVYGADFMGCVLYCDALLSLYGSLGPGYGGSLELRMKEGLLLMGALNAGNSYFTGPGEAWFDWGVEAVFGGNITNQSPLLHLTGSVPLNPGRFTWTLGNCHFSHPIQINGVILTNSACQGGGALTLSYADLTDVSFQMPVVCAGNGICAHGTEVVFGGWLTATGPFWGAEFDEVDVLCQGSVTVDGGSFGDGYGGRLTLRIWADLTLEDGVMQLYRVIFSSHPTHQIAQAAPECAVHTFIHAAAAESIVLATPLALTVGSTIYLNGGTLELGGQNLTDAAIESGSVLSGTLTRARIFSVSLRDVALQEWTVLQNAACSGYGDILNAGSLMGADWTGAEFNCYGNFHNLGAVIPGYGGTLSMRCFAYLVNDGAWTASTLLLGDLPRTVRLSAPGYPITVSGNSQILLQGSNQLSAFTVQAGSQLSVDAGAELAMAPLGEFYQANSAGQGSFTNRGTFTSSQYVNGMEPIQQHQLAVEPSAGFAGAYDSIACAHLYNVFPDGLPDALGEVWQLLPNGSEDVHTATLTFRHSGSLLPREFEMDLRLFYRLDDAHPWQMYAGDYVMNIFQHTFKAIDIPARGQYAFVVTELATPANVVIGITNGALEPLPRVEWDAVPGALGYEVLISDAPDGPWTGGTITAATFWTDTAPAAKRFFRVRARRVNSR